MSLTREQRQRVNQFIAEKCGWTRVRPGWLRGMLCGVMPGKCLEVHGSTFIPEYCASLDACREAAMNLDRNTLEYSDYCSRLNAAVAIDNSRSGARPIQAIDASAEQRALALFQTLGGVL